MPSDVAARDDAHLRSLGIKPELQRRLGFLSNFAVAFSYISVSTGTFTLIALGLGVGGPAFFWSWPLVILGQTFVALNFAELASHFPVAGSIYQWSKRLSNKTLGWFTGWFYFWAGVLTVTAVAATVPLVIAGDHRRSTWPSKDPIGITNMLVFIGLVTLVIDDGHQRLRRPAAVDHQQPRRRRRDPRDARLRGHPADLRPPPGPVRADRHRGRRDGRRPAATCRSSSIAMFMTLFVVYGFDTAGTFGEETLDASRQAPRGILSAIWLSGIVGAIFLLGDHPRRSRTWPARSLQQDSGRRSPTSIKCRPRRHVRQRLPLRDPRGRVRLHAGHPGRDDAADVLDGPRRPDAARRRLGPRQPDASRHRPTPRSRSACWPPSRSSSRTAPASSPTGATGLIYLSYFLCNLGVLVARTPRLAAQGRLVQARQLGHDHQRRRPRLGRR